MALITRIFEWWDHVLGTPGAAGVGAREVLDTVVATIPAFGTGRLTRKNLQFERAAFNGTEVQSSAPAGDRVRFIPAIHYFHTQASTNVNFTLNLRCQLSGTDRDIQLDEESNEAQDEITHYNAAIVIPGD